MDLNLVRNLLFPDDPKFPHTRAAAYDELPPEGLTLGTLYIGKPGSGKTTALARHLIDSAKEFPERAMFVLDPSGSITNDILSLVVGEGKEVKDKLLKRLVYDELGHPEWVVPLPEFHRSYNTPMEKQISRVTQNLEKLEPELVTQTPIMGGLSMNIAPELFRVITAINPNYDIDPDETWQITEAKRLLVSKPLLTMALAKTEGRAGSAHWFFKNDFLKLDERETARRIHALIGVLDRIEAPEIRARVGYHRPGWTPTEAIEKGQIVLVNGQRLNDQEKTGQYLFRQVFSLVMNEINKRTPANPDDEPVAIVLDELTQLLAMPSMAPEIARLSPQYRSRKLQLYVVLQNLSQLSDELRPNIWGLGNIVAFSVFDFDDAFKLAQQLFPYVPDMVKLAPKTETQQQVSESDRGQYLQIANQIRDMRNRECVVRRQISESRPEKYVLWVKRTREVNKNVTFAELNELKESLLKQRGVSVRQALKEINERGFRPKTPPTL